MLMLTLDLQIGPGHKPLPPHLGGALHGFVESGVKNHAPHLLPVLRPDGPNQAAHFMILPPPLGEILPDSLRFGIMLYGASAWACPVLLRALLEQQSSGLNGRPIRIAQAWSANPFGDAHALLERGKLIDGAEDLPMVRQVQVYPGPTTRGEGSSTLYRLSFRSPLLLASRKAQRDRRRLADGLPWPSLASILDSIADRIRSLEPELAEALNLPPEWSAPEALRDLEPLTPAGSPARQIAWEYSATPRPAPDKEESPPAARRTLTLPGIVGDLIYPVTGIEHEQTLLHWGQWLGVGQKTTLGCGHYTLTYS